MSDGQDPNAVRRAAVAAAKRRARKIVAQLSAPVEPPEDWLLRRELVRKKEWALHEAITDLGLAILRQMVAEGKGASLADTVRACAFGSEVGRLACNMPLSHPEAVAAPAAPTIPPEMDSAMEQVYADSELSEAQ